MFLVCNVLEAFLIKPSFDPRLLNMRYMYHVYHVISNARSWINCYCFFCHIRAIFNVQEFFQLQFNWVEISSFFCSEVFINILKLNHVEN